MSATIPACRQAIRVAQQRCAAAGAHLLLLHCFAGGKTYSGTTLPHSRTPSNTTHEPAKDATYATHLLLLQRRNVLGHHLAAQAQRLQVFQNVAALVGHQHQVHRLQPGMVAPLETSMDRQWTVLRQGTASGGGAAACARRHSSHAAFAADAVTWAWHASCASASLEQSSAATDLDGLVQVPHVLSLHVRVLLAGAHLPGSGALRERRTVGACSCSFPHSTAATQSVWGRQPAGLRCATTGMAQEQHNAASVHNQPGTIHNRRDPPTWGRRPAGPRCGCGSSPQTAAPPALQGGRGLGDMAGYCSRLPKP